MTTASDFYKAAVQAFNVRDYHGSVREMRKAFDADPDLLRAQAETYVKSFSAQQRGQFWKAPDGLFANSDDLKSTFELIYSQSIWGGGSGAGSDLRNTVIYVAYLQHLIDRLSIRTIVDLGCGDWRYSKFLDFSGRNYTGVDIVASVIADNKRDYARDGVTFELADATQYEIPPCDLLLCKDVLQHISNKNAQAILARSKAARVALITNDYHPSNDDCTNGSTRPVDITAPPFMFNARPRLAFLGKVVFLADNSTQGDGAPGAA